MTGMEFILDHLEDWKALYGENPAHVVDGDERSPPSTPTQLRERPSRQPRLPSRLQGCELLTPLRHHSQREASVLSPTTPRLIDTALPAHSRTEYVQGDARSVSSIASMEGQERASMRASINNAWVKLNEYYTLLGRSPLFAAAVILNPDLGLRWLEANWTSPEQLRWLRDAKDGVQRYFERWYSNDDSDLRDAAVTKAAMTCRPEQSKFEQWMHSR